MLGFWQTRGHAFTLGTICKENNFLLRHDEKIEKEEKEDHTRRNKSRRGWAMTTERSYARTWCIVVIVAASKWLFMAQWRQIISKEVHENRFEQVNYVGLMWSSSKVTMGWRCKNIFSRSRLFEAHLDCLYILVKYGASIALSHSRSFEINIKFGLESILLCYNMRLFEEANKKTRG